MESILVTGATGFLGSEVMAQLMRETSATVYALVRAASPAEATRRLSSLWWDRPELAEQVGARVVPVPGDITQPGLGLIAEDDARLISEVSYIIHCAAEVSVNASCEHLWAVNVQGTRHVLEFALAVQEHHPLKRLSHVSTAYVAGMRQGHIVEDSLVDEGFGSLYEASKFEGERLVRQMQDQIPISVFRPGQIVGNSETGRVNDFNTLYYPLKLYLKGKLSVLPARKSLLVNMVPVDYVAQAIVRITLSGEGGGKTFHLTAPAACLPTVAELVNFVRVWALEQLGETLPRPLFAPLPFAGKLGARHNLSDAAQKGGSVGANLLALAPYFTERRTYDTANTQAFMGAYRLDWQDYLPRLLSYAVRKNFLNHNGRTVFEQMLLRQKSRRAPITYYDVTASGICEATSDQVGERIRQALGSLRALGVKGGTRVAITGVNSVDYCVLDAAIGLSGAVSVPLYYTTPPDELDALLKKSGAALLFVGDARILERIAQVQANIPIVSFAPDATPPKDARIIGMEAFLLLGGAGQALSGESRSEVPPSETSPFGVLQPKAPQPDTPKHESPQLEAPRYDDVATIRYTSGTTNDPKGVLFDHGQLRWMAETMASLLSWKSRTGEVRYLSFLPMSHVVEGILGAYTPYYLRTPTSVYYLNDFGKLVETLPKVRPTIFFSVPRFYEKLWVQFSQSGAGKLYLSCKPGLAKGLLRRFVRRGLLKRAGLDRCDQLIVGSAPVSTQLLKDFRELGIEIHNAYGLTEAPLITLNRLGDNELGTTGTPLPETQVKLADDGEILVRGPQVSIGYDGLNGGMVSDDGFLPTGDLGEFDETSHLRIVGRKKELLVTAYGKNINLQKVETMLRDIPGVSEAMLVGENRPFCVALLWPEEGQQPPAAVDLAADIASANENLSNPEKAKRWAMMSQPLSIAAGELTPNLKLRRANIADNHRQTIDGLYQNEAIAAGHVHYVGAL